jgi:carnitine 3-dehydrogenase
MLDNHAVQRVAVVGGGTIGASWAALFLHHGLEVAICDPAPDADAAIRRRVAAALAGLPGQPASSAKAIDRLRVDPELEAALAGAQFVQENGPEREDLKTALFARMDAALPPDALIASSTSGLIMTRLQSGCVHPERCVIGHPFNPPHLIPLVEVVGGEKTSAQTVERAMRFYRQVGKYPVRVNKEVPGHIANRLQAAMWREAVHLVATGVASVADIDATVAHGPGLRWALAGPHMTFHLGGGEGGMAAFLAHIGGPMQTWWADLGHPELTPAVQRMLVEGVADEAGGRSVAELARDRDERLNILLAALGARLVPPTGIEPVSSA